MDRALKRYAAELLKQVQRRHGSLAPPKEKIVCGMRVIEADPSIDPKMVMRTPEGLDARIVRLTPPVCHD
jgi:hypothetical protein